MAFRAFHLFTDFQLQRLALRGVCRVSFVDLYSIDIRKLLVWPVQGELVYKIFFWLLTVVVIVSTALCLFVAQNFKTNNFPYIW